MNKKKVIFLDRDGTINVDHGYVHQIEDWNFTDRAVEALKKLQEASYLLVVLTSQSGIGHGLYKEGDVQKLHEFVKNELKREGVELSAIIHCPHRRDAGCNCRKPEVGMVDKAEQQIGPVDYGQSWMVGDKVADLGLGKRKKMKTALIRSRYWQQDELEEQPDIIVGSLFEAANRIVI
ncbi:MAG: HAD family hydrolase [bacterium]